MASIVPITNGEPARKHTYTVADVFLQALEEVFNRLNDLSCVTN